MWEWFIASTQQLYLLSDSGEPMAVELTSPGGFSAFLGLAFVLYAIRQTNFIPVRFMPLIAIVLGLLYSVFVEFGAFNEKSVVAGLRLGLLGVGSVATIKYLLDKSEKDIQEKDENI